MSNLYFEWDKDFETGNKKIDNQHYSLVALINELMKINLGKDEESIKKLEDINSQLSNYTIEHFKSEEKLMDMYLVDPRHTKKHKEIHKYFIKQIENLGSDLSWLRDEVKVKDFVEYLIRWLAYHILNTDKSLFRQLDGIIDKKLTPKEAYEKEEQVVESNTEPLLKALKALYNLVSEKNKELEQKNKELEEKVINRTKELTDANTKLEKLSLVDELTGLYNRRFVIMEIEKQIYNWNRYKVHFSLIYVDADKFKGVNDNFGHEKGDFVLKWVADFLKNSIRKTDIACRLGGDEFLIICLHCNEKEAEGIGKNLINKYQSEPDENIIKYWKPSLSIGIATISDKIKSSDEMLKAADSAMYTSKNNGGNQVSVIKT